MFRMTLIFACVLAACGAAEGDGGMGMENAAAPGGGAADGPGGTKSAAVMCQTGESYMGFGGRLELTRDTGEAFADRRRTKPFAALKAELTRIGGAPPAALDDDKRETLGESSNSRFYVEPESSALGLFVLMEAATQACAGYVSKQPNLSAAPDAANAKAACQSMAHMFWHRAPGPGETDGCVQVATTRQGDTKTTWARACAAVLTSAGFLTY